jgi:hypothetical protein
LPPVAGCGLEAEEGDSPVDVVPAELAGSELVAELGARDAGVSGSIPSGEPGFELEVIPPPSRLCTVFCKLATALVETALAVSASAPIPGKPDEEVEEGMVEEGMVVEVVGAEPFALVAESVPSRWVTVPPWGSPAGGEARATVRTALCARGGVLTQDDVTACAGDAVAEVDDATDCALELDEHAEGSELAVASTVPAGPVRVCGELLAKPGHCVAV